MIKIHANVSKKVPVPNLEYSSQSYMAGLEVEISDGATDEQIKDRLAHVYAMLEASVDREIALAEAKAAKAAAFQAPGAQSQGAGATSANSQAQTPASGGPGPRTIEPRNRRAGATAAQVKAIFAISKDKGLPRESLFAMLAQQYGGITDPEDLSVKQASEFIQKLIGNGQH